MILHALSNIVSRLVHVDVLSSQVAMGQVPTVQALEAAHYLHKQAPNLLFRERFSLPLNKYFFHSPRHIFLRQDQVFLTIDYVMNSYQVVMRSCL